MNAAQIDRMTRSELLATMRRIGLIPSGALSDREMRAALAWRYDA